MQKIDLEGWERRALLANYFATDFPYILLCADVNVANLYAWSKAEGLSFYFAMVYVANRVANSIRNFRYRVDGEGQPWLVEANRAIFTHMQQGAELFHLVEAPPEASITEFCRAAAKMAAIVPPDHGWAAIRNQADAILYSAVPWVRFTSITRTVTRAGYDCAPRITWGKYEREGDRLQMPLAVQVHHGLMDGYHIGLYYQRLQAFLDERGWLEERGD